MALTNQECVHCGDFIESGRYFTCRVCRQTPLCIQHLDREYKICVGCASDRRLQQLNVLQHAQHALESAQRFLQFIFLTSSIFIICKAFLSGFIPDMLLENPISRHMYIWASLSLIGYITVYIFNYQKKQEIEVMESKLRRFN